MAWVDNLGPGQRGTATGMANYLSFLQSTAAANELLANSQYIEDQQRQPMAGISIPNAPAQTMQAPGLNLPAIDRSRGVLPQQGGQSWVPWENLPAAPGGQPGGGNFSTALPWKPQPQAGVDPNWGKWIPAIPPTQGPLPVAGQAPLVAGANAAQNFIFNSPQNLMAGLHNTVARPLMNTAQMLLSPPQPQGSTNIEYAGQAPKLGASVPQSAAGTPPVGNAGFAPSGSAGLSGASAGPAPSPSIQAGPAASKQAGLMPTTADGDMPRDVRDEALKLSPEDHNYYQEQLLQQRAQIEEDVNRQIAFFEAQKQQVATVQQQKLTRLMNDASSAQRTGNIGLMKKLQDEAEAVLLDATQGMQQYDMQAQALRENAITLFRQNEQDLWRQQALQAESEFINTGDPSRMLGIFDAYGYPVQLEDAGGGKFFVIDITEDGKGRRRGGSKATSYTPDQIGDMFHSMISDEFRQMQATSQAASAAKMLDHQLELDKIDAQAAADIQKEMAKSMTSPEEYMQQTLDDGSVVYFPKSGVGNAIVYNPAPPEIPNSGGLLEPKVKTVPVGG